MTRHNDRSLRGRGGSWVKNGDRWVVRASTATATSTLRVPVTTLAGSARHSGCRPNTSAPRAARVRQHHPRRSGRHRRHDAHRGRRHRESTRAVVALSRGGTRTTSTCRIASRPPMGSPSTCPPTTAPARCSPGSSIETIARNPRHGRWLPTRPESSRGPSGSTRMHCHCSPSTFSVTRRSAHSTRRSSVGCPV